MVYYFGVTQFILPKSYTSSTDITIMPQGELLDYTSYLNGNVVLERVGSETNIDVDTLLYKILLLHAMKAIHITIILRQLQIILNYLIVLLKMLLKLLKKR